MYVVFLGSNGIEIAIHQDSHTDKYSAQAITKVLGKDNHYKLRTQAQVECLRLILILIMSSSA
jgi:prophage maintenance system killer protein